MSYEVEKTACNHSNWSIKSNAINLGRSSFHSWHIQCRLSLVNVTSFLLLPFPTDCPTTASSYHDIGVPKRHRLTQTLFAPSRLLSHAIQRRVLDPSRLPMLLRSARAALFPGNAPAPPRVIPSPEEQLLIRRRCAERLLDLVPQGVRDVFFGGRTGLAGLGDEKERRTREVEELLNVFGDAYCNKHFVYGIVELIVVRLMPEMAEKGARDLLDERLN